MPLGQAPLAIPGIGPLMPYDKKSEEFHRKMELRRKVKPRNRFEAQRSIERSVFVYSVGPFMLQRQMASLGLKQIAGVSHDPGQREDEVPKRVLLINDLRLEDIAIAGPLAFEGNPAEPWRSDEQGGKWIPHEPPGYSDTAENPGLHLANIFLQGGGNFDVDYRGMGVFVSTIPAPIKNGESAPEPPNGEEVTMEEKAEYRRAVAFFKFRGDVYNQQPALMDQWQASVSEARRGFINWCARQCDDANGSLADGSWTTGAKGIAAPRDVKIGKLLLYFTCARILKKTAIECPFLVNTVETASRKACIECGSTMQSDKYRCPACKTLQVSDEEYKDIKKAEAAAYKAKRVAQTENQS